mmetsp:Transcript_36169/g.117697  ORF Transcript_36169/g.117697 Transcript_36169/m.117697 type:complete len:254 (-) Transcript_36169:9-770(-)
MRTKLLLRVSFLGTNYCGWQPQPACAGSLPSVCETLQAALRRAGVTDGAPVAAGRLDKGVHAMMQVVTVTVRRSAPAVPGPARDAELAAIATRLNEALPADVRVLRALDAHRKAHAMSGAGAKTYTYYAVDGRAGGSDGCRRGCWVLDAPLNMAAMRRAAAAMEGEHDWAALCTAPASQATRRTVASIEVRARRHASLPLLGCLCAPSGGGRCELLPPGSCGACGEGGRESGREGEREGEEGEAGEAGAARRH